MMWKYGSFKGKYFIRFIQIDGVVHIVPISQNDMHYFNRFICSAKIINNEIERTYAFGKEIMLAITELPIREKMRIL